MSINYRNYQYYNSGQKTKKARLLQYLFFGFIFTGLVLAGIFLAPRLISGWIKSTAVPGLQKPQLKIEELWEAGLYNEILAECNTQLAHHPLSQKYLLYQGFASYHKAFFEQNPENKAQLLDNAIVALRRARLVVKSSFFSQIDYILGKAYYHKGEFYYDLAVKYLEQALAKGYKGSDCYEYLGLAYGGLNIAPEKELEYFLKAADGNDHEQLLLSIAKVYIKLKSFDAAWGYLNKVLEKTANSNTVKEARLSIALVYEAQAKKDLAEQEYLKVIEIDPFSYIAHQKLSLLYYEQGDRIKGRYYERKANSLAP